MRLFPINKNTIALSLTFIIVITFFAAGVLDVLDYFIVKSLLFLAYGILFIYALIYIQSNEKKKKKPS